MLCYTQDLAVASTAEGLLVAVAGAPGVVLYCLEKDDSQPGPGAWRMSQRARLCPMWAVCAVSMSADGSTLAAAALGSQLHVWDLQPGLHAIRLELRVLSLGSCCSNLHGVRMDKYSIHSIPWVLPPILCHPKKRHLGHLTLMLMYSSSRST